MNELVLLAACWIGYFALHSALASRAVKRAVAARWPRVVPAYRLGFNAVALLLILPLLAWTLGNPGPELWRWRGPWRWVADGSAALALIGALDAPRLRRRRIPRPAAMARPGAPCRGLVELPRTGRQAIVRQASTRR